MGSLLRRVKERKKTRRLGEVEVMEQEGYGELEVDSKVEMIRALVPLGLMHVHELLDAEVSELAGERYVRKSETVQGRRHGTNPGTVKLAGQRVPIRVPRVRGRDGEIPLSSYESLSHRGEVDELLLRRVLYGISCRNYESAAKLVPGAIGLSSSSVSRGFVEASAAKLREMQERDLSGEDVVAMVLDGKTFADGDVLRFLSKKNDVWFPKLKPVPVMGTEKENHTSWERYYRVSDCSSSSRNNWYLGR